MLNCIEQASDFGFLAFDVVQNEYTNAAKPAQSQYLDIERNGLIISKGPAGGWCSILRRSDYRKIKISFNSKKMNMKKGENGRISHLMRKKLNLRSGILKDIRCFHACGPYYSKLYGRLDRDITKYRAAGLTDYVNL